jgi:hypothetical protein
MAKSGCVYLVGDGTNKMCPTRGTITLRSYFEALRDGKADV